MTRDEEIKRVRADLQWTRTKLQTLERDQRALAARHDEIEKRLDELEAGDQ